MSPAVALQEVKMGPAVVGSQPGRTRFTLELNWAVSSTVSRVHQFARKFHD